MGADRHVLHKPQNDDTSSRTTTGGRSGGCGAGSNRKQKQNGWRIAPRAGANRYPAPDPSRPAGGWLGLITPPASGGTWYRYVDVEDQKKESESAISNNFTSRHGLVVPTDAFVAMFSIEIRV